MNPITINLATLVTRRTTATRLNPWEGNRPRLKSHPKAYKSPRLLVLLVAAIMVSSSTTEVAMPNGIEIPQDHLKYGQNFGKQ